MFIGREKEINFLKDMYEKEGGQMVILYGRRRVGKTETLSYFCEDKDSVFYSCIECPDSQQLAMMSERVLTEENPASKYIDRFSDWNSLFENLAEMADTHRKRLVVVIDEFPYMVKNNASIPSILQNCWDHKLKNTNILLILCGSSMSFIEKEILSEKNPLYGRATGIYKMQEMDYQDAFKFLEGFSIEDKIAAYAILGGIPYYLKQFDTKLTLAENVIKNILTPGSILYSEVEFLLRQELRETGTYNAIIQAIALGNTKLNDIYTKTSIEKTKLSVYLKSLSELGIIWRELPVDAKVKERANINRGLYRITDNYFAFWYAFVFPSRSELETGDGAGIWKYTIEEQLGQFVSYAFERICWQYLRLQNQRDMLPFHFVKIGHWWDKQNEIDILAVDFKEDNFIIGECKYRNTPVGKNDLEHLKNKFPHLQKNCLWYLFSKSGFTDDLLELGNQDDIALVSIEKLEEAFS